MRGGDVREVHLAGQDLLDDRQVKADLTQGPDQLETSQRLEAYRRYPAALRQQGDSRPWSEYQRTVLTVTAAHRASSPVVRYPATSPLMGPSPDPYVTAQSIALAAPAESEIPATAGCVVQVAAMACNWPCHQVNWCWRALLSSQVRSTFDDRRASPPRTPDESL